MQKTLGDQRGSIAQNVRLPASDKVRAGDKPSKWNRRPRGSPVWVGRARMFNPRPLRQIWDRVLRLYPHHSHARGRAAFLADFATEFRDARSPDFRGSAGCPKTYRFWDGSSLQRSQRRIIGSGRKCDV